MMKSTFYYMSQVLSVATINKDKSEQKHLFKESYTPNAWGEEKEPLPNEVDTYMQIAKLNKIYLPPSKLH